MGGHTYKKCVWKFFELRFRHYSSLQNPEKIIITFKQFLYKKFFDKYFLKVFKLS